MTASSKAMLLSGLVYPGLGQMHLGHKLTGIMLILGTSTGLIVLAYRLVQRAYRIMEQAIPRLADEALDLQTLKELFETSSAGGWGVEVICLIAIAGCWLLAIVHAYFIGKKVDRHPQ